MVRAISLCLCLIASLAVLANGLSTLFEDVSSPVSLSINPLNADARVNTVTEVLSAKGTDPLSKEEAERLVALLDTGLGLAPADSRFLSLKGIVEEQQGSIESARTRYRHALLLQPTEFQARLRSFLFALRDRDYGTAADHADILLRRWWTYFETISPYLPLVMADKTGFERLAGYTTPSPNIQRLIIAELIKKPETLKFGDRLIRFWKEQGVDDLWPLANRVTARQFVAKQYQEAHSLFFFMLQKTDDVAQLGYVYNDEFNAPITQNIFDWRFRKQPGVAHQQRTFLPPGSAKDEEPRSVLEIRFLNGTIRYRGVGQYLRLPPGRYALSVTHASQNLKLASVLSVAIACGRGRSAFWSSPIEPSNDGFKTLRAEFRVPAEGCVAQHLFFSTNRGALSWRERASGSFFLDRVSLELLGS